MTTREEATFILLAVLVVCCFAYPSARKLVWSPFRLLLGPNLLIPFVLYVGWLVLLTVLVDDWGFWSADLLAGTILWFLFTGFRYFLNVPEVSKQEHFFRKSVIELAGVAALFEFFLNVRTLGLWVELVLQVALLIFGAMFAVSGTSSEFKQVRALFGFILGALVIWQITATVVNLADHWSELHPHELISLFLLPVWLTIGTLPVIYLFGLYAGYELLFVRMGFGVDDGKVSLAARLGVASELRGRLHRFDAVNHYGAWGAGHDRTFSGGRQTVRAALATEACRDAEAAEAADRLVRYAGMAGTDEDGHQLDQREFKETRDALRWLATCQMGWYQREEDGGRYRSDMLTIQNNDFTRFGLPAEHGITLRVSKDGQRWYAVRGTVTGWVFAIGSSEAPPNQWLYDGQKAPTGFPGKDRLWGQSMFEAEDINWW